MNGENATKRRDLLVFAAAAAAWLLYFYVIDRLIMAQQGLPVGWDLMPLAG